MTEQTTIPPAAPLPVASPIQSMVAGIKIALVMSAALGIAEGVGAAIANVKHFEAGLPVGWLIAAAVGKAAVTHAILWCPIGVVVGIASWLVARRRAGWRPEPVVACILAALGGLLVVPTDLDLAGHGGRVTLIASAVIVIALAMCLYGLLRVWVRRWSGKSLRIATSWGAALAICVIAVSGYVFANSPLARAASSQPAEPVAANRSAGPPNVLWIVLDTVRADRMSCNGFSEPTTPFLDEWSRQAVTFERAMSNATWTVPSHASMFTGLSVREHGMDFNYLWLSKNHATVAERLAAAGYRTVSLSNNAWISRPTNLAQGFETCGVVHFLRRLGRSSIEYLNERSGLPPLLPWLDSDTGAAFTNYLADEWLDQNAGGDAPVFMFVNYMEAHLPYRVPAAYRRMFMTDEQVRRSYSLRWRPYGDIVHAMSVRFNTEGRDFMQEGDIEILKRQYLAAIRYLDDRVRDLIGSFKARGLLDNTLVIVCSDHGEYLDTHGMWDHRFLAYDDVAHVSLLVHEPGRTTGLHIAGPIELADLYRIVMDHTVAAGDGASTEGPDLLAAPAASDPPRIAITEYNGPTPTHVGTGSVRGKPTGGHRDQPQIAASDSRYKLMVSADGTRELYDIVADPGETRNLISDEPDQAATLAEYIKHWQARAKPFAPGTGDPEPQLDADTLSALEAMGYFPRKPASQPIEFPKTPASRPGE